MNKIFTSSQIQGIDKYTIENEPIASIDLMERASAQLCRSIRKLYPRNNTFVFLIGPGNNGGDGLAIARMLAEKGVTAKVFLVGDVKSKDAQINLERLKQINNKDLVSITQVHSSKDLPNEWPEQVYIDALFGSGLTRPLEGLYKELIVCLNKLKRSIISIDIPSGLFGEDNQDNDPDSIINATHTLSLEFVKLSLLQPENEKYVGQWHQVSFGLHPQAIENTPTPYFLIEEQAIQKLLRKRTQHSHKGTYGHALLVAGSRGKGGAALLAARACMRSGVGLVTAHVPEALNVMLQVGAPETMLSIDSNASHWSETPDLSSYSAIGLGPGLGTEKETRKALRQLLSSTKKVLVLDADALNMIASEVKGLEKIPKNSILTPHPKEFDRLFGAHTCHYERIHTQWAESKKRDLYLILKGAHTSISSPEGMLYFNTSGNPGMATGGSGDVLTGFILGLVAQQYSPLAACLLGVYLHGKAGDAALAENSYESLIASDMVAHIGKSFNSLRKLVG